MTEGQLEEEFVMSMTRKQRDELAKAIQQENELVLRLGRMVRTSALIFAACVLLCIWGWTGMIDPMLPNINETVRTVVKWVALIGAILSGIFTVLSFLSHRNGKKSVLAKIDKFQNKK